MSYCVSPSNPSIVLLCNPPTQSPSCTTRLCFVMQVPFNHTTVSPSTSKFMTIRTRLHKFYHNNVSPTFTTYGHPLGLGISGAHKVDNNYPSPCTKAIQNTILKKTLSYRFNDFSHWFYFVWSLNISTHQDNKFLRKKMEKVKWSFWITSDIPSQACWRKKQKIF